MGAGVLPYTFNRGKLFFLFGLEQKTSDTPGWADFGGGKEGNETIRETALREWEEEMSGILGNSSVLRRLMDRGPHETVGISHYTTFLVPIVYDESLPVHYNNMERFFERSSLDTSVKGLFEKHEIRWFSVAELKSRKRDFRPYYQEIVDLILKWSRGKSMSRRRTVRRTTRQNVRHRTIRRKK